MSDKTPEKLYNPGEAPPGFVDDEVIWRWSIGPVNLNITRMAAPVITGWWTRLVTRVLLGHRWTKVG